MDELHASLTPNIVNAGEKLTVEFDSTEEAWKTADEVIVRIFEIDDASPLEPKPGKDALLVVFHGRLDDNQFTLTPRPGGKPNPETSKVKGSPPQIEVVVGSASVDVPLPDADHEHGIFELRMQVEFLKPKRKKFTSQATALVRWYQHFQVSQTPRPVITFVVTARSDSYFTAATEFWKLNADAVVAKKGMSMEEVLEVLDKESAAYGDWGQINIVAHGRAKQIGVKILKDSDRQLMHRDKIEDELDRRAITEPAGVDGDTQIVFRACNAGREQELVEAIHTDFFGGSGTLHVPKFVQVYEYNKSGKTVTANEWFEESLTFDTPGSTAPTGPALEAGLKKAFATLQSPGAGGDPNVEIKLFKDNHDWVQDFPVVLILQEHEVTEANGKPMNNNELVKKLRADWRSHKFHEKTVSWKTDDDRWHIELKQKTENPALPKAEKQQWETEKKNSSGWWLEVTSGSATPKFQQFVGGAVSVGSAKAPDVWVVSAPDAGGTETVADLHAHLEMDPANPMMIKVEDADSGTPTVVKAGSKKHKLTGGGIAVVPLPAVITMGNGTLRARRGKVFYIEYTCKRYWVDRRRELRKFDPSKTHGNRDLVRPRVKNSHHFGVSGSP